MGKQVEAAQKSGAVRVRPLPMKGTVRLRKPLDIWYKHGFSAAVATVIPNFVLLALGRMDLVMYASAGAMCALYAHSKPYSARSRSLARIVLGTVGSMALGLLSSALIDSTALLVLLASLVAAAHKTVCDATRIGPPGNVVMTFIAATSFFVPQQLGDIPLHVGLALLTGAGAWLVCMAPALVRPHGPERIATARALEAAAALLREEREEEDGAVQQAPGPLHHGAAAAVNAAWHTLFSVRVRTSGQRAARTGLERLLVHAEAVVAGHPAADRAAEAERCTDRARRLRGGGPLPEIRLSAAEFGELAGIEAERTTGATGGDRHVPRRPLPGRRAGLRGVLREMAPGSPLLPVGFRTAAGCALAGWASMAVGVGHPYWAVVTAASVYQANTSLSWQRAVQRTLGNFVGLLAFTAMIPLVELGFLAMILLILACQIGAEALISRNYWLGSVCVTPMALLLSQFGDHAPAGQLIGDRWIDTVVGAAVGLLCCVLVTNRRAGHRLEDALQHAEDARAEARRLLDPARASGRDEAGRARDRLAAALAELREAEGVASGEWWQRALPEARLADVEREGHRELARLVRRMHPPVAA